MIDHYPPCLKQALTQYDITPSGNIEWDKAMLNAAKNNHSKPFLALGDIVRRAQNIITRNKVTGADLADPDVYEAHCKFFVWVANNIVLAAQNRRFEIDDNNRDVLRFLLYYFNGCPLAEQVFPSRGYKLHKNILIQGAVGAGKTLLMQCFSEYLRRTDNPRFFHNVSVTQMVNYFTIHNNIDRYTYNEEDSRGFAVRPYNLCLNDIGVENRPFYGIDTLTVVNDFLHARNEIWTLYAHECRCAHLTTNLTVEQLKQKFSQKDAYGRIIDRFKTYNIVPLPGASRR